MKLLAYLKINIKGLIKEFPAFLLSYGIYPIIIALVMGYMQKDLFTPTINNPIFSVIIQDEDNTVQSENLVKFLNSEEMSNIMTVKTSPEEKYDYTIRIPQGYEDSLLGNNSTPIKVEAEEKASTTMGNILMNIIDKYNEEVSQGLVIYRNIENMPISPEEKENLILEISNILTTAYTTNPIKNNIHNVRKSLNSYEYYSITFLSFAFIIFMMAVISSDALEKERGIYHRIMSTSMTRLQYFNYGFASNYLTIIVANIIYIFAYRITGLSFQGPLPLLLLIILVQSLLITGVGTLISTIFKKKYGLPLIQILLIVQMVFGGMLGPITKFNTNKTVAFLSKIKLDILFSNTYRNYLLDGTISSISNYLFIMVGISLFLYILNILAVQMKWGVSK